MKLLESGIFTLAFFLSLQTITVKAEMVNDQQSEYYSSRCSWGIAGDKIFRPRVVVINYNQDKTAIKRIALADYNSNLIYQGSERNNWYTSGSDFPMAIFGNPQELKLISTSKDNLHFSFYGYGSDRKFHSENVNLNLENNMLTEIVADYEKQDDAFSAKDYLRCIVEKKLSSNDVLKMNHLDIYKYPLGGSYSDGRKLYKVRYSDLGYFAQKPDVYTTTTSWNYALPGVYTLKVLKLIQRPFRRPIWVEIYNKEFNNAEDFLGMDSLEFDFTFTDKFYPEGNTRMYPGGDNPKTTIVINKNDWKSDLKIELSVCRVLNGAKSEINKSFIVYAVSN